MLPRKTWLLLCLAAIIGTAGCNPGRLPPTAPAAVASLQAAEPTPGVTLPAPPATEPPPPAIATSTAQPLPTITPTVPPARQPEPAAQYFISAILDYDTHRLDSSQRVIYNNRTGQSLSDLVLVVQPAVYPGSFQLTKVEGAGGELASALTGSTLKVTLAEPLAPGGSAEFTLTYQLNLPRLDDSLKKGPIPLGYTANQTNLVDWYPFVPPYDPESGWIVHEGNPYGEHLAYETAAFDVNLTVAGNWARLFVAASAPAEMRQETYHYALPEARSFAVTVSHLYEEYTAQAGAVTVKSYGFPIHKSASKAALDVTVQALELYEELFGKYPHQELTVVEADFLDGMEYDGLYFLSRGFYNLYGGTPGEYLVAIAAHETAHQWWYALVGNDQALEPWLDEALCTYSEKLYYERYSPEGLQWWWEYRVAYYNPAGWVDVPIYPARGRQVNYNQYRDAVYLRGAMFLEEVRKIAGDEAFFAFLQDYVRQFTGKIATRQDFFRLLAEHSDADFSALIAEFFEKP